MSAAANAREMERPPAIVFRSIFVAVRPILCLLLFAQNHFALAHQLVVQPQAIFIRCRFASRARRAAEQPHACRGLKNVRRKRAAIHIKFNAQIACVGNPGDLVAFIEHDDLRDESNEYGTFSHFFCGQPSSRPPLLIALVQRDDSIFPGKNSCGHRHYTEGPVKRDLV